MSIKTLRKMCPAWTFKAVRDGFGWRYEGTRGESSVDINREKHIGRQYLTRPTLEVLLLAAEHDIVRATLASAELGGAQHNWWGVFRTSVRKGLLTKQRWGAYALAPAGLAILRDVAEGRAADRWGMRAEIVAAIDGGRASGRRTIRGAA